MYCKYCGNEISDDSQYCQYCDGQQDSLLLNQVDNGGHNPINDIEQLKTLDEEQKSDSTVANKQPMKKVNIFTIVVSVAVFLIGTITFFCFNNKAEENFTETISVEKQETSKEVNTDWIEKETATTDFINYNTIYNFSGQRIYVGDNNYTPKKWYHYKYSEARFSKVKVTISVGGSTYTSRIVSVSFTMNRAMFGDKKAMIKTKDGFIEFWEMRDGSFSLYGKHKNLTFIFNDYFPRNEG